MSQGFAKKTTKELDEQVLDDEPTTIAEVAFRPVPKDIAYGETRDIPIWRVRFEVVASPGQGFGLDINGEIILGRVRDATDVFDLTEFGAANFGISRRHLMLRPTPSNLFVVDLDSTNGTQRNGRSIGRHIPSRLVSGDILTLGRMELRVRIIERPSLPTGILVRKSSLADAMSQIARAVTSQLDLNEVLNHVVETAMLLTAAGETGIWLVDEETGELFLEAERGIEDEKVRHMRLPSSDDTLMGQVIRHGETRRAHRLPGEDKIKVKTHYLVEALIYVPIMMEGMTLGVLAAVHREPGKQFKSRDEQLLEAIADFAAIAIQNARLYQSTDKALRRRVQELAALNEVSSAVSSSLDLNQVYDVLVDQVTRHWPVEAVRLYLLDDKQEELIPHNIMSEEEQAESIPVGGGIIGVVAAKGEALVTNDVEVHSDFDDRYDRFNGRPVHSIACVPLQIQERVVGVLALFNKAEASFTNADVERLRAFANPVSTAIENARLYAESERQRAAITATARAFSQPLIILDERGDVLIANQAASEVLETSMADLFAGISAGVGKTTEIMISDRTFLTTADRLPGVGTIVIMQDITYVQQLERDRSEFVHMLSHDLKTPLNSILGWSEMLRADTLQSHKEEYAVNLSASAERMIELIDRMLRTTVEADIVKLVRQECHLQEIVDEALKDAGGVSLNKSITLRSETTGEPFTIWADRARLYHLILNLVDNAIKYSPDETTVNVHLHFTKRVITIRVEDEGPGIPEEDMAHIFDKYYRGTKAKLYPGTGLGLSVVRAIAEAHGGEISVCNRQEGGAEFTVKLPGILRNRPD